MDNTLTNNLNFVWYTDKYNLDKIGICEYDKTLYLQHDIILFTLDKHKNVNTPTKIILMYKLNNKLKTNDINENNNGLYFNDLISSTHNVYLSFVYVKSNKLVIFSHIVFNFKDFVLLK
jgi:hypothetical protein